MGVQSCVKSVKSTGLSTQPCGELVFRMRVEEVLFPILTPFGRCERKSMIHEHSCEQKLRVLILLTSL